MHTTRIISGIIGQLISNVVHKDQGSVNKAKGRLRITSLKRFEMYNRTQLFEKYGVHVDSLTIYALNFTAG